MSRIIGIDLGAHRIKIAEFDIGLRSTTLRRVSTIDVLGNAYKPLREAVSHLGEFQNDLPLEQHFVVGVPGDLLLHRWLSIPFSDARKIQAVISQELQDDLPWPFEEALWGYSTSRNLPGKVTAAIARRDEIAAMLEALKLKGCDPRLVVPAPLSYGGILRRVAPTGYVALIDLGHLRTNIAIALNGDVVWARTSSFAGHHLSEALKKTFQCSYERAETIKINYGNLPVDAREVESSTEEQRVVGAALAKVVPKLSRDISQSFEWFSSQTQHPVERVVLCGGTSLLRNLDRYLAAELNVPVSRLSFEGQADWEDAGLSREGELLGALAMGVALEQGRRSALNLRQGEFSYRTDASFLRNKAAMLVAALILVVAFMGINAYAALYGLQKENKALHRELERASAQVLGTINTNPSQVSRLVKQGAQSGIAKVPEKTALDIFNLLSESVPARAEAKLDVQRLEIGLGKIYLKGESDSRSTVGNVVKALEKVDCFSEVSSGKISDVGDGKKQFDITIKAACF